MISDLVENSSRNLPSSIETAQNAKHCPAPVSKVFFLFLHVYNIMISKTELNL